MASTPRSTIRPAHPAERPAPTGNNAKWDAEEEDDGPLGDPAHVADEGPLESLGKAVASPMIGSERPTDPPDGPLPGVRKAPR